MFCKNCGKEVSDGTKFCPNCGAQLGGAEQQASGTQQTTYTGTVNGAAGGPKKRSIGCASCFRS